MGPRAREGKGYIAALSLLYKGTVTLAVISFIALLSSVGFRAIARSPFLELRRVEAQDGIHVDRWELLRIAGIRPGVSILSVNLQRIKAALEAHPWIERAWVERRFPDTIRMRIKERVPVGVVVLGGRSYLLDRNGLLFKEATGEETIGLVRFIGLTWNDLRDYPETCRRLIVVAIDVIKRWEKVQGETARKPPITEMSLDPLRGIFLRLSGHGPWVELGARDILKRLQRLEKVLAYLNKNAPGMEVEWIYLNHPSRAMVRLRGAPQAYQDPRRPKGPSGA